VTDPAVRDALAVSTALAARIKLELETWARRESRTAPRSARQLANIGCLIAEGMSARCAELAGELAQLAVPIDDVAALNRRARFAETLHSFLDSSSHKILHPVLCPTLEYELARLGIPGAVLVCGTREILYEIETITVDLLAGLIPPRLPKNMSWPLLVFRVPNVPLDWPPHHVLLYHEIGHALVKPRLEKLPDPGIPDGYALSQSSDIPNRAAAYRRLEQYIKVTQAWFEEVYADAVGALLAGPAYLFAFARFTGAFLPIDVGTDTHPPMALRIRYIREVLAAEGLMGSLDAKQQALADAWIASDPQTYKSDGVDRQVMQRVLEAVRREQSKILSLAKEHTNGHGMTTARVRANAARAKLLRSNGIPPIERSEGIPLPPADVFGTIWSAFLDDAEANDPGNSSSASRCAYYARVLLGALDGVDALRVWKGDGL
jgi:hypothetical protein